MFTWVLACLPIFFVFYKQTVVDGLFNISTVCATGELFIVSIVMVAEPLGGLVIAKTKSALSLVFALLIIIVLVSSAYFFCIIEMNESRVRACMAAIEPSHNQMFIDSLTHGNNIINTGNVPEVDNFIERITFASQICIVWSFVIGFFAIIHMNFVKERMK